MVRVAVWVTMVMNLCVCDAHRIIPFIPLQGGVLELLPESEMKSALETSVELGMERAQ